jgi:hypothetical protein
MRFRQNGYDNWHLQLSHSFHDLLAHLYIFYRFGSWLFSAAGRTQRAAAYCTADPNIWVSFTFGIFLVIGHLCCKTAQAVLRECRSESLLWRVATTATPELPFIRHPTVRLATLLW